jgi:hypothetical protein
MLNYPLLDMILLNSTAVPNSGYAYPQGVREFFSFELGAPGVRKQKKVGNRCSTVIISKNNYYNLSFRKKAELLLKIKLLL